MNAALDETHDPALASWVHGADALGQPDEHVEEHVEVHLAAPAHGEHLQHPPVQILAGLAAEHGLAADFAGDLHHRPLHAAPLEAVGRGHPLLAGSGSPVKRR